MIEPYDPRTFYKKGLLLRALKRIKKAIECYDKVIELDATHVDAVKSKGEWFRDLNRRSEDANLYFGLVVYRDYSLGGRQIS
mmetsp:Transcript_36324/g.41395  ORF Transcript_36324/g.41395 Transcript_36324/m.41395 type:complete len:82 (+) Transcript_36324:504-749(+)